MSGHGLIGRMLGDQMIVNGMLVVIAVSTLTFAYRHLRHVRGQRQSVHSRARRAPDTGRIPSPANPPGPAADLLRQASDRAAAKLAAAKSEAAQVQAALMKLSTELGEAAAATLHPAAD
jgi:hypothetical protein